MADFCLTIPNMHLNMVWWARNTLMIRFWQHLCGLFFLLLSNNRVGGGTGEKKEHLQATSPELHASAAAFIAGGRSPRVGSWLPPAARLKRMWGATGSLPGTQEGRPHPFRMSQASDKTLPVFQLIAGSGSRQWLIAVGELSRRCACESNGS